MFSTLYYLFLVFLCTFFMILSALALVICWPFDKSRRVVHELSRIMVHIFLLLPPRWRWRTTGCESIDKKKSYVIVVNHNAMIDIPSLYSVPLNFRWVSKREVFRIPFFGQYLLLHGDIGIDRGHASGALEQLVSEGKRWISYGASVAVFPEGTRSKDGEIHRFKTGAFTLAKEAGVAVLPVVLDGTKSLIRPNLLFNWRNCITVRVLPPIPAETVAAMEVHALALEAQCRMTEALAEIRNKR